MIFGRSKIKKLEKLKTADAPMAKYAHLAPDDDRIFGWANDLVNMGVRLPGLPAGDQARQYMVDRFTEAGLENIHVVPARTRLYQCQEYSLEVDGENIPAYFINYTGIGREGGQFETPEGGLEAELVYIGSGREKDLDGLDIEGKIVVSEIEFTKLPMAGLKFMSKLFYDPDKTLSVKESRLNPYGSENFPDNYIAAKDKGAAGFIGILKDYFDSCEYNNEDYSYHCDKMDIPGYWVTRKVGDVLKKKIAEGPVTAKAVFKGYLKEIDSGAVIGFLPGKSEETIMVESHFDSTTPGATEDAGGAACLVGIAEYLGKVPASDREKTIMFAAMDSHYSDYDTHDAVVAKFFGDDCKVIANLCVEHIARELAFDEDGKYYMTGQIEPRIVFFDGDDRLLQITEEEFVRHGMKRTSVLPADVFGEHVLTDADEFYQKGVPIVNLISGPIYLYDNIDTADKIAKEELNKTVLTMSDILWRI